MHNFPLQLTVSFMTSKWNSITVKAKLQIHLESIIYKSGRQEQLWEKETGSYRHHILWFFYHEQSPAFYNLLLFVMQSVFSRGEIKKK